MRQVRHVFRDIPYGDYMIKMIKLYHDKKMQ
jgi:hypothetical protein